MQNEQEQRQEETTILDSSMKVIGIEHMIIPQCCRENWDSCKHVAKKHKQTKNNIGL